MSQMIIKMIVFFAAKNDLCLFYWMKLASTYTKL